MRVKIVFEFDLHDRLAIANQLGGTTPASYRTIRFLIKNLIRKYMLDIHLNYDKKNDISPAPGAG